MKYKAGILPQWEELRIPHALYGWCVLRYWIRHVAFGHSLGQGCGAVRGWGGGMAYVVILKFCFLSSAICIRFLLNTCGLFIQVCILIDAFSTE